MTESFAVDHSCLACKSGHHEDPAFAFGGCTCPCHQLRRSEVQAKMGITER